MNDEGGHIPLTYLFNKLKHKPRKLIYIPFVHCWTNVEDVGPTLYKRYTNVLCLLGWWLSEAPSFGLPLNFFHGIYTARYFIYVHLQKHTEVEHKPALDISHTFQCGVLFVWLHLSGRAPIDCSTKTIQFYAHINLLATK